MSHDDWARCCEDRPVSDSTEAEKAAARLSAQEAAAEWIDKFPHQQGDDRLYSYLAKIILRHMQPVIDAVRAEGCKPTRDDKAAAEQWLSDQFNPNQYFVNDVNSLSVVFALKRAEGRRERDEAKCSTCGHAQSHCAAVAHSNAETIDRANAQWQKVEAALERVRALFGELINLHERHCGMNTPCSGAELLRGSDEELSGAR